MWQIPIETDVEHRLKIDGGKPLFAWLDFRLMPSDAPRGIAVSTAWVDSDDGRWLPAIEEAVTQFVNARENAGRSVGRTGIEMSRVISHPIDTDDYAVTYNMRRALEFQFKQHEVETQP